MIPTNPSTKIALVTGASSEIGAATVARLISRGYFVLLQYNKTEPVLDKKIRNKIHVYKVDFSLRSNLSTFVHQLGVDVPHLDLIVNCAAQHEKNLALLEDPVVFEKVAAVNVYAPIALIKNIHTKMKDRENPSVIFISSYYALGKGSLKNIFYASTKTSLLTISRVIASECSPIRSNVIIPGYIKTKTYQKGRKEKDFKLDMKSSLNNDFVKIDSIVKAIDFIIDNKSVNATQIRVDGGLHV